MEEKEDPISKKSVVMEEIYWGLIDGPSLPTVRHIGPIKGLEMTETATELVDSQIDEELYPEIITRFSALGGSVQSVTEARRRG
jgi:hypothetical protein